MTDHPELTQFLRAFRTLAHLAETTATADSPFAAPLEEFLGIDPLSVPVVTQEVSEYRYADWDAALEVLQSPDDAARVIGVVGGEATWHLTLSELIDPTFTHVRAGHPERLAIPSGAGRTTSVLAFALRLFHWQGAPVAVLQRRAHAPSGQDRALFQVLSPVPDLTQALLTEVAATADAHSHLRGQAFSLEFAMDEGRTTYRFLPRPDVAASDVVLPDGVLDTISRHVTGIAAAAARLRAHGQHLKRGVLLYGPPGTGKTHTVKHLLAQSPDHTAILLRGMGLTRISEAAELARRLQPSIIVLEDCDLVAEDRSLSDGTSPLLFEVLDAVDGLDADVDVTFVLTTNRVEVLEEALAQRPGRVDLAVEIPLPDEGARLRLLQLYRGDVDFSDDALDAAAQATEGQTASFSKELIRRAVLLAVLADEAPGDRHLIEALEGQLAEASALRERMLEPADDTPDEFGEIGEFGGFEDVDEED